MNAFIATPFTASPCGRLPFATRPSVNVEPRRQRLSVAKSKPSRRMRMAAGPSDQEEETVSMADLKARLAQPQAPTQSDAATDPTTAVPVEAEGQEDVEDTRSEQQKEIDRLRAAEKFIEVDEGKFECTGCGYLYEPSKGDARSGIAAGTAFEDIPETYTCPQCRTPKRRFVSRKKVIAGFADNQNYGFGSNTMTGGQKSLLIFGGLGLCFLLLLSGYAMN